MRLKYLSIFLMLNLSLCIIAQETTSDLIADHEKQETESGIDSLPNESIEPKSLSDSLKIEEESETGEPEDFEEEIREPASLKPGLKSYSWFTGNFLTEYKGKPAFYRTGALIHQETDLRLNGYIFPTLLSVNGFIRLTNGDLQLFSEPVVDQVVVDTSDSVEKLGLLPYRPYQSFDEKWPAAVNGAMQTAVELESINLKIASSFGEIKPFKTKTGAIFYRSFSDPDAQDGIVEIFTPGPTYIPEIEGDIGFYANFRSTKTSESTDGKLENLAIGTVQIKDVFIEATQILLSDTFTPSKYFKKFDSRSVLGATWSNGETTLKGQGLYRYVTDTDLDTPFWIAGLANIKKPLYFIEGDIRYAGEANVNDSTDEAVLYKAGVNDNRFKARVKAELMFYPLSILTEEIFESDKSKLQENKMENLIQLSYGFPAVTPVIRTWLHTENIGKENDFVDIVIEPEVGYKDFFSLTLLGRGTYDFKASEFNFNYGTLSGDITNITSIPVKLEGRWTPADKLKTQEFLLKASIKPSNTIEITPLLNIQVDSSSLTAPVGFNLISSMTLPWENVNNPMAFISMGYNLTAFDKVYTYKDLKDVDIGKGASITLGLISDFY